MLNVPAPETKSIEDFLFEILQARGFLYTETIEQLTGKEVEKTIIKFPKFSVSKVFMDNKYILVK